MFTRHDIFVWGTVPSWDCQAGVTRCLSPACLSVWFMLCFPAPCGAPWTPTHLPWHSRLHCMPPFHLDEALRSVTSQDQPALRYWPQPVADVLFRVRFLFLLSPPQVPCLSHGGLKSFPAEISRVGRATNFLSVSSSPQLLLSRFPAQQLLNRTLCPRGRELQDEIN